MNDIKSEEACLARVRRLIADKDRDPQEAMNAAQELLDLPSVQSGENPFLIDNLVQVCECLEDQPPALGTKYSLVRFALIATPGKKWHPKDSYDRQVALKWRSLFRSDDPQLAEMLPGTGRSMAA